MTDLQAKALTLAKPTYFQRGGCLYRLTSGRAECFNYVRGHWEVSTVFSAHNLIEHCREIEIYFDEVRQQMMIRDEPAVKKGVDGRPDAMSSEECNRYFSGDF